MTDSNNHAQKQLSALEAIDIHSKPGSVDNWLARQRLSQANGCVAVLASLAAESQDETRVRSSIETLRTITGNPSYDETGDSLAVPCINGCAGIVLSLVGDDIDAGNCHKLFKA